MLLFFRLVVGNMTHKVGYIKTSPQKPGATASEFTILSTNESHSSLFLKRNGFI